MRIPIVLMLLATLCLLTACGGGGGSSGPTPVPTLTSLTPVQGSLSGGTAVTLTGTGFAAGATVTFGAAPATSVVVVDTTTITCVTPAGTGTVAVEVTVGTDTAMLPAAYEYVLVLTNADFTGTYQLVCFRGSAANNKTVATLGSLVADGAGMVTPTLGENDDGTFNAPALGTAFSYFVAADGQIAIDTLSGGLSQDGSVAVLSSVQAGDDPMICLLLRRSGAGYSDGTMNAPYHLGGIEGVAPPGIVSIRSRWTDGAGGPVLFDGAAGSTYPPVMENLNGTVTTVGGGGTGYAVAPDGVLTTGATWVGTGLGAVTSDGAFAAVAGGNENGATFAWLLARESAGLTNGAFSGTYWAIGISSDPTSANSFASFNGTVTADGAGAMNYVSTTENAEGVISTPSGPDVYAVGPTGILTSGPDRIGGITADGRFAFLAGASTAGGSPMLFLFVRK